MTASQSLVITGPYTFNRESAAVKPKAAEGHARVKTEYGGICGSDLSVYKGKLAHANYPVVMGHELYGTVVEADDKGLFTEGQKVVVQPNLSCGECDLCHKGKKNICRNKQTLGVTKDGGFTSYIDVPVTNLLTIPEEMDGKLAVLIEPLAVVVHAFRNVTVEKGDTVAVLGCGTEGMLSSILANLLGADVTAVDINEEKLKRMDVHKEIKAGLPEMLEEEYDHVVEAAGVPKTIEQSFDVVKPGGNILAVGITGEPVNIDVNKLVRSEVSVFGSIIYDFPKDFERALHFLKNNPEPFSHVVSEIYPFSDYEKAFETALFGTAGKVLIDFKEGLS
ncbi:zinc-dependent alcohol dehydrogenase [Alteribacillus bidgolensis]|uniref:L-iditol 2-dehydrogenase n=1 Tax=Alteribacillus bidgolensis TaxID=930129 RepID=A0A1G8GZI7_9BACI|nr:alcohol dehydrogenase catalytic domain-containing protein [Alteribacillus bidgolensis]SDH99803.1 L-iditol 2-dehydrogenase [Alteribacillus bidgolensis]